MVTPQPLSHEQWCNALTKLNSLAVAQVAEKGKSALRVNSVLELLPPEVARRFKVLDDQCSSTHDAMRLFAALRFFAQPAQACALMLHETAMPGFYFAQGSAVAALFGIRSGRGGSPLAADVVKEVFSDCLGPEYWTPNRAEAEVRKGRWLAAEYGNPIRSKNREMLGGD